MTAASRNLPGPLGQAETAFRDCATRLPPVSGELLAQRAGHFAAGIRLSLDEPAAMRRLHEMTGGLRRAASLSTLLPRILDGALSLMGADFGTLQLLDPVTGSLRLVTQSGFTFAFLDHFAMVEDGYSACGRVAREGAQVVITDVEADQGFAPHRDIAAASGFRAVAATPLAGYAGRLIGVVSTHYRQPYQPPGLDLQIMGLYADCAGEAIAGQLGVADVDSVGDPVGRAMISALLDPPADPETAVIDSLRRGDGRGDRRRRPAHQAVPGDDAMAQFADYVVTQLFRCR